MKTRSYWLDEETTEEAHLEDIEEIVA